MKGEFYKMDFRAWNLGTVDLSLEQEAAYLRLCHAMYDARGPVPDTTRLLQGIFRCGNVKASALVRQLIEAGKIERDATGRLLNRRVLEELALRRRGDGPSPRASVASLRDGCGPTADPVTRECRSRASSVNPEWEADPHRVTTSKALQDNDLISTEKRRGEENRGEQIRSEADSAALLTSEQEARIEAAFGPAVAGRAATVDPGAASSTGAERPVAAGPKRREPPEAYFIDQDDGFRVLKADIEKWQEAFPHLNVAGEVLGAADWVMRNWGKDWFHRMRTWLAGKDREAKADADARRIQAQAQAAEAARPKPNGRYYIP